MCKESFGKRLRRHTFPVSKTYYLTDVAKRLRVLSLNIYVTALYFNGRYVPYSSDQPWHLQRAPARKPNAYFIDRYAALAIVGEM